MYRTIQKPVGDEADAVLIRLVQRAARKKSVWPPLFTSTFLARRIEECSGVTVQPFDIGALLGRFGVLARGTGQHPYDRRTAELHAALRQMILLARRIERRKLGR